MRVGVVLGGNQPEAGGAYTFERGILHPLSELHGATRHEFIVFTWRDEVVSELAESGLQIVVLSTGENSAEAKQKCLSGGFLERIPVIRSMIKKEGEASTNRSPEDLLLSTLRDYRIDIVWYLASCLASKGLTMELPFITVVWDLQHRLQPYFPEISARGIWEIRDRIYSRVLRRASVVIVGTKAGKTEVEDFYAVDPERIRILPHPAPAFMCKSTGSTILTKYNIPGDYLFYPAQFWPHKNHANLLLAVQRLRDLYGLTFPAVFTGSDQGNLSYIKKMVSDLGLSELVHFLGFVPEEDLVQFYQNAFALAYVTFFGPENMPPLEAFALNCPVIASRVSGSEEQLGDCALLVDPKSPDDIAMAIKRLYDNPSLRSEQVKRAAERPHKFTGEDFVRGVFTILDEFEPILRCWDTETYFER